MLPSVTVFVFDKQMRVLLARHRNNNVWVAPGGMVEPDEIPMESAIREMQEETGCGIRIIKMLGTFGGPEFRLQYENGDEVGYVMTAYEAEIIDGKPAADGEEILELRYFSFDETKLLATADWLPTVLKEIYETRLL